MRKAGLRFEICAVSLAAILLEIAYTRIFSFKIYYFFTYLILGIALLGIGSGGVLVATLRPLRESAPERLLPGVCSAAALAVLVGYLVIAPAPLNVSRLSSDPAELAKLLGVCALLLLPFLATGVAVASILSARPGELGRLYAADLIGAGLGCALVIPLLSALGPPRCVMLAGLVYALAGLRLAAGARQRAAGAALAALCGGAVALPDALPDAVVDQVKQLGPVREAGLVRFSGWSPVFRVDAAAHPQAPDAARLLYHDGQMGSSIPGFDGDWSKLERMRQGTRALPFAVSAPSPRVLIIGAAGGSEVLASLFFGARQVTAVELNPVTVSLLKGRFADFSGRIAEDPRVSLLHGEGRSFLARTRQAYDLIWFVAPDSYAAMNAASSAGYVLSESYLYTVEAIRQSLARLAHGGIVCTQFGERDYARKPNRTARYVRTARAALEAEGIRDFGRHVLVVTSDAFPPLTVSTVLLARQPFDAAQLARLAESAAQVKGARVRHAPDGPRESGIVRDLIGLPEPALSAREAAHAYQLTPVRDDAPFFWHFARFRDALGAPLRLEGTSVDWEDAIGERVVLLLLAIAVLLGAVSLLSPALAIRSVWRELPCKGRAGLYFAALGTGFMFLEVGLIQRLTLFLGYPTYSLSVTLFALLVSSGIGSALSERYRAAPNRALAALLGALALLVAFYELGLPLVVGRAMGAPQAIRFALAGLLIAPLGLCLGAFMPLGLGRLAAITPHTREYLAWAWAVNGFFSVISAIGSTLLAMGHGFRAVMLAALCVYALGVLALSRIPLPAPRASAAGARSEA